MKNRWTGESDREKTYWVYGHIWATNQLGDRQLGDNLTGPTANCATGMEPFIWYNPNWTASSTGLFPSLVQVAIATPRAPCHVLRDKKIRGGDVTIYGRRAWYPTAPDESVSSKALVNNYASSRPKTDFSGAILPNVDQSRWNLARIRCCTEYKCDFN